MGLDRRHARRRIDERRSASGHLCELRHGGRHAFERPHHDYELWNEPNLQTFFEGTPQNYIDDVLVPGAEALHAACASCKVVAPALATVGTTCATWLDAVLTAAQSKIDVLSGHDYAHFPQDSPGVGGT